MNQIVSVSLGGSIFEIEQTAYKQLQDYIHSIQARFANYDDVAELMTDIETRMAEVLQTHLKEGSRTVVTSSDVEMLMTTMGSVDDIAGDKEEPNRKRYQGPFSSTNKARLFRDPDNKMIAGVCAGLAAYFGVDVTLVRAVFLILLIFTGFGGLLYFVLWVAMPEAQTTTDKIQMHGEPVTIPRVEDAIKRVSDKISEKRSSAQRLGSVLATLLKVFAGLIAAAIIIPLIIALIVAICGLFFGVAVYTPVTIGGFSFGLNQTGMMFSSYRENILLLGIPAIVILGVIAYFITMGAISIAKNRNVLKKKTSFGLLALLVVAIIVVAITHRSTEETVQSIPTLEQLQAIGKQWNTHSYTPQPFSKLDIGGNFNIHLIKGDDYQYNIYADQEILDQIHVDQQGDTFKLTRDCPPFRCPTIPIDMTIPTISSIKLSGAASINSQDQFVADTLTVDVSGASDANILAHANTLTVTASGASDVTGSLSGEVVTAKASGASDVTVEANVSLDAHASGASDITYSGAATSIQKEESGGSDIKKE